MSETNFKHILPMSPGLSKDMNEAINQIESSILCGNLDLDSAEKRLQIIKHNAETKGFIGLINRINELLGKIVNGTLLTSDGSYSGGDSSISSNGNISSQNETLKSGGNRLATIEADKREYYRQMAEFVDSPDRPRYEPKKIIQPNITASWSGLAPDKSVQQPAYIQEMIDNGIVYPDGKRAMKNIESIADFLFRTKGMQITAEFLCDTFLQPDGSKYSKRTCRDAISNAR